MDFSGFLDMIRLYMVIKIKVNQSYYSYKSKTNTLIFL
jgi:hypothetical protein